MILHPNELYDHVWAQLGHQPIGDGIDFKIGDYAGRMSYWHPHMRPVMTVQIDDVSVSCAVVHLYDEAEGHEGDAQWIGDHPSDAVQMKLKLAL